MGVCLSFTTKGKLIRQMQKIKTTTTTNKVLFRCCGTWENDRFPSQNHLLLLVWKKVQPCSARLSRSQRSEIVLYFKVQFFGACRQLLRGLSPCPGSLACSWLLSISGSLLGPSCRACMAISHAVARATWSHAPGQKSI